MFGPYASETFAAYYQAQYLNHVAEAGKREFPLPMFLNVWTDIQDGFYEPGFSHPSGGATTRMLPLYKALVPAIDWISPDIYKQSYVQYIEEATPYSRPDNPLLIPETGRDLGFCRRMFYALGDLKGIGVSVFGVEGSPEGDNSSTPEDLRDLSATYRLLGDAAPLPGGRIWHCRGSKRIHLAGDLCKSSRERRHLAGELSFLQRFAGWKPALPAWHQVLHRSQTEFDGVPCLR